MSYRQVTRGEVEPIRVYAVDVHGDPLTGATDLYIRIQRVSDNYFLDWADVSFKASGHTTISQILAEVDVVNAAGIYELVGGFDTGAVTNLSEDESLTIIPVQTPGTDAKLPAPEELLVKDSSSLSSQDLAQMRYRLALDGTQDIPATDVGTLEAIRLRIG